MILATFYTHYGAMLTKKKMGDCCTLRPVPRSLSSSCGTCACIEDSAPEAVRTAAGETLEALYRVTEDGYEKILSL